MKFGQGCDLLNARLTELLQQVTTVQRTLANVDVQHADAQPRLVSESFGELAEVMAGTLGDVNDRLDLLDQVLKELREHPRR